MLPQLFAAVAAVAAAAAVFVVVVVARAAQAAAAAVDLVSSASPSPFCTSASSPLGAIHEKRTRLFDVVQCHEASI